MKKEAGNRKDEELWRELLAKDPVPPQPTDPEELLPATFQKTPPEQTCSTVLDQKSDTPSGAQFDTIPTSANHLEPAVGQLWAERFRLMEQLRDGAGRKLFRARQTDHPGFRNVEIEFLGPTIAADPEDRQLLAEQVEKLGHFEKLESFPRKQLVAYYHFEPDFLVREWLHGFSLESLLTWKGTLTPQEIVTLLDPLPPLLDQLARQVFQLVRVRLSEIFLAVPDNIAPRDFPELAKQSITHFEPAQLKLNPLSLAGFVREFRDETTDRSDRHLVADEPELQARRTIRLFGELIYELLSGHRVGGHGTAAEYQALPKLGDAANHMLRTACVGSREAHTWPNCKEFWDAFRFQVALSAQDPVPFAEVLDYDSDTEEEPRGSYARYQLLTKIRVGALAGMAVAVVAAGVYLVPQPQQSTVSTASAESVSKQPIAAVPLATANTDALILTQPDDSPSPTPADDTGVPFELAAAFWAGNDDDAPTFTQPNGEVEQQNLATAEPTKQPADSGAPIQNDAPPPQTDNPQPNIEAPTLPPSSPPYRNGFNQHDKVVDQHSREPASRHSRVTQTHVERNTRQTAWARFKGNVVRTFRATKAAITDLPRRLFSSR
jgi:hypothetical protein